MNTTSKILEKIIKMSEDRLTDTDLAALAQEAREVLETRPRLFISTTRDGVNDVSSNELIDVDVFVIDETSKDPQGQPATIAADDESTYEASVKKMAVTPTHFSEDDVIAATEGVYANGMKL